jgi:hypothetical protein
MVVLRRLPRPGGGTSFTSHRIFTHGSLLLRTAQSSADWDVNQDKNYSLTNLSQRSHLCFYEKAVPVKQAVVAMRSGFYPCSGHKRMWELRRLI